MKIFTKVLKWTFLAFALFLTYVIICLLHGTATDYQPQEVLELPLPKENKPDTIKAGPLRFLNWNVGYGGLGASSNFFYDNGNPFFFSGGKMVRSPKAAVEANIQGIADFIAQEKADFVLLQEVDRNSKRSYYINQHERYLEQLPNYSNSFAPNYKVERVVIPVAEPWHVMGKMESGLSSYSKYKSNQSTRYQFPGSYGWPDYIFHLDRCLSVQHYPTIHPEGKELVVINTHNSAYDGGKLKDDEMAYFKQLVLQEYEQGNYIVVGGDWNQTPPGISSDAVEKSLGLPTSKAFYPANIASDFMPEGWQWVYDLTSPTNRSMIDVLDYGKTTVTLVDFYLVSPNVRVKKIEGKNLKFKNSDHNPILLEIELIGLELPLDPLLIDSTAVKS
ncbi:MAG: Unknown protein [uncultured Aureispira sp.]|uniref:Endonuclease/exonuclease/phosphatase domain-containing protein n=1 Tax=uncultured Aureispira sp. TaxID=1331704 RepID=A0A6S6UI32_9BACT|nr:MAG: Unknown protein [uncultured Aureispira sp.]